MTRLSPRLSSAYVHLNPTTMKAPTLSLLCIVLFGTPMLAADETPAARKQATKEEIQARLAEHARKKALGPTAEAAAAKSAAEKGKPASETAAPVAPAANAAKGANNVATDGKSPTAAPGPVEAPNVLPKVEVRNGRITELDRQVQKQNQEIAREKVNTKPTKLDETLNGPKVSKALAIFGGQSSDDRANVAKERVAMMEDERDLIEAIAQATDKNEKEELQKTLDQARAMRRDLESALR
jgi:hypothetical protein